jgi:N-acetylneuraminic acid mutarotase
MAQIKNNKVLLYSGAAPEYNTFWGSDTWIYDIEKNDWDSINTSNKFSWGADVGCAMLDTGKVITFSGWAFIEQEETGIFDINLKYWKKIQPKQKATPNGHCTMAGITKDIVLLFGGSGKGDSNALLDDTWMFTLHDTTWKELTTISPSPRGRSTHCMAKVKEGRVLLFGGKIAESGDAGFPRDTWLFTLDGTGIEDNRNNKYEPELKLSIHTNSISLVINKPLEMKIVICDILGRELECIDTGILGTGEHSFRLNTNLNNGLYIVSAIYNGNRYTYKCIFSE